MQVTSVTGSQGSGGTPGACTLTIGDQTSLPGQPTTILGSISTSGALTTTLSILSSGQVLNVAASPAGGTYNEPVTGCNLTGAAVNLSYGVALEQMVTPGAYVAPPCSATATASVTSSGSGTLATFFCGTNFLATASWGTDNTCPFQAALAEMNADSLANAPRCLYIPAGNFLLQALNTMGGQLSTTTSCGMTGFANLVQHFGCFFGDEHDHSNIFVIPQLTQSGAITADVFASLNSNANNASTQFANTQTFADHASPAQGGGAFRNLTIVGDRSGIYDQNALTYYGNTGFNFVNNVTISYIKGRAFLAGAPAVSIGKAVYTESRVTNVAFDHDGDGPSFPTMEITSSGTFPGPNNIDLLNIAITNSFGLGLLIHEANTSGTPTKDIRIVNTKIDGSGMSLLGASPGSQAVGDLMALNDTNLTGTSAGASAILCRNLDLINPPFGSDALHVVGKMPGQATDIDCAGSIRSFPTTIGTTTLTALDQGRGLHVEICQQCSFTEAANTTQDFNVLIGAFSATRTCASGTLGQPALAAPGLIYNGNGAESMLSTCLDPLSLNAVAFPDRQLLANGSLTSTYPADPIQQTVSQLNVAGNATLTFVGGQPAVTVLVNQPLWTVLRGGTQSGPFTDTWDTGSNIVAAINASGGTGFAATGQTYRVRICNTTTPSGSSSTTESLSAASGVTLRGTTTVPQGSCGNFLIEVTSSTGGSVTIVGG